MKVIPVSIAGRTLAVLIFGMLAVVFVSIWVASVSFGPHNDRSSHFLIPVQLRTVAQMLNQMPAAMRRQALQNDDTYHWSPQKPSIGESDWHTRWLLNHLRQNLPNKNIHQVEIGQHPHHARTYIVAVQIADDSWLSMSTRDNLDWPRRSMSFVMVLLVFTAGIVMLAVVVTRRITMPLCRFAAAADRFGADINTPPLPETGPSELQHASRAFNRMQKRVRRYVQERTQMIAAISHDLRTPLTRLRLRIEELDDPEQRQKAEMDIEEMQAMIKASLDFARHDSHQDQSHPFDLCECIRGLCENYRDMQQTVTYQGPDQCRWHGRADPLRRAFTNIIDNALRYGQSADITLNTDAKEGVTIAVADRGPGIPESEREAVFSPFYRIESSRSRDTGGTGLGLSVAQTIVREHGGDIAIRNRAGGGAVFTVHLPRS